MTSDDEERSDLVNTVAAPLADQPTETFYAMILAVCNKCAFVRPHLYKRIASWIEQNPAPSDEASSSAADTQGGDSGDVSE